MNDFLKGAKELQEELTSNRRYLHANAETGFDLPKTVAFVMEKLTSYGYTPIPMGGGIVCTCGIPGKTLMIRADMDALPQQEASGLPFACQDGACHSCGHDSHIAMLLGAAKILKAHESELKGTVKFLFQPAEELLGGAKSMIKAGALENPKVDAAMAFHINYGPIMDQNFQVGTLFYSEQESCASADAFEITVHGTSAHGSTPHVGVNALSVAANIIVALQQFFTLQVPSDEPSIMSICQLHSGSASNIIPSEAVMQGSIRTFTRENRAFLLKQLHDLTVKTAQMWGATAEVNIFAGTGPTINDRSLSAEMGDYCREVLDDVQVIPPQTFSEDFSYYGEHVPTFFAMLYAGGPELGHQYSLHDPRATFDESALPYGSAAFCNCAYQWLKNHCE